MKTKYFYPNYEFYGIDDIEETECRVFLVLFSWLFYRMKVYENYVTFRIFKKKNEFETKENEKVPDDGNAKSSFESDLKRLLGRISKCNMNIRLIDQELKYYLKLKGKIESLSSIGNLRIRKLDLSKEFEVIANCGKEKLELKIENYQKCVKIYRLMIKYFAWMRKLVIFSVKNRKREKELLKDNEEEFEKKKNFLEMKKEVNFLLKHLRFYFRKNRIVKKETEKIKDSEEDEKDQYEVKPVKDYIKRYLFYYSDCRNKREKSSILRKVNSGKRAQENFSETKLVDTISMASKEISRLRKLVGQVDGNIEKERKKNEKILNHLISKTAFNYL